MSACRCWPRSCPLFLPKNSKPSPTELVERELSKGAISEFRQSGTVDGPVDQEKRAFAFARRNDPGRTQVNWNYVWMPFAACILLMVALGIYAYRVGQSHSSEVTQAGAGSAERQFEALVQQISDAGHEREVQRARLAEQDKVIAELHHQTEQQARSLSEMTSAQSKSRTGPFRLMTLTRSASRMNEPALRRTLKRRRHHSKSCIRNSMQRSASEPRTKLRTPAYRARSEISPRNFKSRDTRLPSKTNSWNMTRDIRDLMGARDLYVAEVYDVKRDGSTQKSYGRVFYTKGKSLIFYAYDLNEEPEARDASTFQAWGRRGPDRQEGSQSRNFLSGTTPRKNGGAKIR